MRLPLESDEYLYYNNALIPQQQQLALQIVQQIEPVEGRRGRRKQLSCQAQKQSNVLNCD